LDQRLQGGKFNVGTRVSLERKKKKEEEERDCMPTSDGENWGKRKDSQPKPESGKRETAHTAEGRKKKGEKRGSRKASWEQHRTQPTGDYPVGQFNNSRELREKQKPPRRKKRGDGQSGQRNPVKKIT